MCCIGPLPYSYFLLAQLYEDLGCLCWPGLSCRPTSSRQTPTWRVEIRLVFSHFYVFHSANKTLYLFYALLKLLIWLKCRNWWRFDTSTDFCCVGLHDKVLQFGCLCLQGLNGPTKSLTNFLNFLIHPRFKHFSTVNLLVVQWLQPQSFARQKNCTFWAV